MCNWLGAAILIKIADAGQSLKFRDHCGAHWPIRTDTFRAVKAVISTPIQWQIPLFKLRLYCTFLFSPIRPSTLCIMSFAQTFIALLLIQAALPQPVPGQKLVAPVFQGTVRLDRYEVTNRQMAHFLNEIGNIPIRGMRLVEVSSAQSLIVVHDGVFASRPSFADHPAVEVTFAGARAYCEWAGKRLPTEREWERICKSDQGLKYPWGRDFNPRDPAHLLLANLKGNADGYDRTAPVGSFPAGRTTEGIWDLGGNVWEWTAGPNDQPILRGGSWANSHLYARCAIRDDPNDSHTFFKGSSTGFRCITDLQ